MATITDPNGSVCDEADLDGLGWCYGDAVLDCAGNWTSPSGTETNVAGWQNCSYLTPVDDMGDCCGSNFAVLDCAGRYYFPNNVDGGTYSDPLGVQCNTRTPNDFGYCCGYFGCTDSTACNYDPRASYDDGSCSGYYGCTIPGQCAYDPGAGCDDGSCTGYYGCNVVAACNYDPFAGCDDGSCSGYYGCNDSTACNYDPGADCDDGSCGYFYDFAQGSCVSITFPSPAQVASNIAYGINNSQTGTLSTGGTSRPTLNIAGLIGLPPFIQL